MRQSQLCFPRQGFSGNQILSKKVVKVVCQSERHFDSVFVKAVVSVESFQLVNAGKSRHKLLAQSTSESKKLSTSERHKN
jgi:hypothetical protein